MSMKKLTTFPDGNEVWSVPYRNGLPDVDPVEARMFRAIADAPTDTGLKAMPEAERNEELSSIAATINRAGYHRRRFVWICDEATERLNTFSGRVVLDQIAKYIACEAASSLSAARSTLELIYYVAQRRAGVLPEQVADGLTKSVRDPGNPHHGLPEIALLRGPHSTWFDELNDYRNAGIHCGAQEKLGYYPIGSMEAGAGAPDCNVMLIPDRASLKKTVPGKKWPMPTRPHEWTYAKKERLETLVADSYKGLLAYATDAGRLWGGALPTKGTVDGWDAVIVRPSR